MKKIFLTLIFSLALIQILQAQWTQIGPDILGDVNDDRLGFRNALAMDSTGNTIAVGAAYNDNLFPNSGYARVMDWDGSNWVQRGNDIIGTDTIYEATGYAVDLSSDGMTLAVSSPWGWNSLDYKCGNVRVFDWDGISWIQRGSDIEGEGDPNPLYWGDVFGWSLQLNSSGDYIIVGAPSNSRLPGTQSFQGHARVYHWDGTTWNQVGQDIDGPMSFGTVEFGFSVGINNEGDRIIVGGRSYTGLNPSDQEKGMALTLEFNGSVWVPLGDTIFGSNLGDKLGNSVDISGDGNTIVIAAPTANNFNGETKIFDWNGINWVQRGTDILGSSSSNMTLSGSTTALSNNGAVLTIGEHGADFNKGAVRSYRWNNNSWQQIDNTISPPLPSPTAMPGFGWGVDVNFNGFRMIAASPLDDAGKIRVYENITLDSTWHCFQSAGCQWAGSNPSFPGQYASLSDCQAACNLTSINTLGNTEKRVLVRTIDVFGRESKDLKNQPLFYIYDDGIVEKRIIIE